MSAHQGSDKVTLKIPRQLYEHLRQVIDGTGFHSVTEFAVYVLRDVVTVSPATPSRSGDALSGDEIRAVRERLRKLGYL